MSSKAVRTLGSSGSVTGLLIGGQPLSSVNPLWITGTLGTSLSATIGNITTNSGSLVGLLYGGVAPSSNNPFFVTGAVGFTQGVAVTSLPNVNATVQSGSITGLLYGGVAASQANPVWITGSVGISAGGAGGGGGFQNVTASIPGQVNVQGNVTASIPITDSAVARRFGVVSLSSSVVVTGSGITTIYSPATGKSILWKWVGLYTPDTNTATAIVNVYVSGGNGYIMPLTVPGVFQHAFVRSGSVNAPLLLSSSVAQTIYANFDVEDI